jgi:hypothetical protein
MESKLTIQKKTHCLNSQFAALHRPYFWLLFSIICLGFITSGCEQETPSLAPVGGKVFYQDYPVPSGAIVFVPDADRGNNGPLAQGTIQRDGKYTIQTNSQSGAMPGWYRVTVIAVEESSNGGHRMGAAAPRSLVPEKYRDPRISDLACEVKAGRENTINFNLTP